ncbi:hypothetical protein PC129_g13429 [Phytophthora cactorum]|uniref:Uncharacterized protein n=2 Tax=Phytophthora cactorum TaxID=29920 RepID=A0A329SRF5_9STRA|nr:hypothetical protein Pcac1_g24677 [Phytophthora cactorum]KAG2812487.1 hypothetical protein PC112_g15150 [Phytophthora cactorum]KAG2814086.1 hypothetical protein PC111_g14131 [Phytophthora cactorum]KAG2866069.1 hypothetical protein PC113_g3159 [Phytophthora cactorum]KAG2892318.1 hypothetical protein PC114_g16679 [Phytophthora cactorum]
MVPSLVDDAACTAALRGLLSILPSNDSASQREASSLSLVVNFRHVAVSSVQQRLQSVAAIESYSHSLQRYPLVKQAFWEQVLASELMLGGSTTRRQQLQLQLRDERFPRLVLDFSRRKVTVELLETLAQFLAAQQLQMTPIQPQFSGVKQERHVGSFIRVVPVALKLVRCRLTTELIEKLKSLLLREKWEYGDGTRVRYCVTSLDLSENAMKSAELTTLADLLEECGRRRRRRWEMPLEELVLENTLGRVLMTDNWAAFRAFVGAAFGVSGGSQTPLKRLSLANNSLSFHHVGCICSALRSEDTALEELSLAHTFSLVDPEDRKTCWQWLAIGLRSMIPREGKTVLRRLDLSGNPLFPMDSEAWITSLRDPQTTVTQWLEDVELQARPNQDVATIRCLLSSSTELYSSPGEDSPRLHTIEKEVKAASLGAESKEWEVLASLDGDPRWLCVVIPGFGVAWTQSKHAMSWEHTEDGFIPGSATLLELVMNDMAASLTTTEAMERFVGGFGGGLRSLELRRNALSAMDLDAILADCQQLHTLDVEGCRILQLQLLVDALNRDLGRHLRTLNLNANLVGADSVNVLAAALRGQVQENLPVLQEVRVAHNEIGANGVRHLHAALEANKTLTLVELDLPNEDADAPRRPDDDEYIQLYRTRCMRLDVSFQNELLGVSPLPDDRKFTFLLALNAQDLVLDRGICSVIFSYAASEKRRCILWNSAHP